MLWSLGLTAGTAARERGVLVASILRQGGLGGGAVPRKLLGSEGAWGTGCSPVGTEGQCQDLEGGRALCSALITTPTPCLPTVRQVPGVIPREPAGRPAMLSPHLRGAGVLP